MNSLIKKDVGLEEKLGNRSSNKLDEVKRLKVESKSGLGVAIVLFEEYLPLGAFSDGAIRSLKCRLPVLNSQEIYSFMAVANTYDQSDYFMEARDLLINHILSKSFDYGNNDFVLDFQNHDACKLLMKSDVENQFRAEIMAKEFAFNFNNYANIDIVAKGNKFFNCGIDLKDSKVAFHGLVYNVAWRSNNSEFEFYGKINSDHVGSDSKNCIYRTDAKSNIDILKKSVSRGNRIVFVDNGVEEIVRDYAD
tara:strand:- start:7348 stop:8097 length:750 start_codon:yes stop_codon:yes gene_type:complete